MERIEDYALIGNGRSAALISKNGSIDWLCWPRFDSPSLFGSLLDSRIGGFWKISPVLPAKTSHRYFEETPVLQTDFQTESGSVVVTDFMVALSEEEKKKSLQPEHELIRIVSCERGKVEIDIHFAPRPDYGRITPHIYSLKTLGLRLAIGQELISLRHGAIEFSIETSGVARAKTTLSKGESVAFSLTYTLEGPAVLPPVGELVDKKLKDTIGWWKKWVKKCRYQGRYRKEVIRSALTLKLLDYAPSGAFIAAPTTSLPEKLGGELNWDYRFCWLRDASFTVRALFGLGYVEEADAFVSWLLHSTRLTLPKLQVLYDIFGQPNRKEKILSHLEGYASSRPVRVGNLAAGQLQLDIYGEVIEAVSYYVDNGGALDNEMREMLRHFGKYICAHWREPDNGIWEDRDHLQHYTHSRLLCWVALDRLIAMNRVAWIKQSLLNAFIEQRDLIRQEIEARGWNNHLQSYTTTLDGETLDASLLLIGFYALETTQCGRMQLTHRRIMERLRCGPGLLYRREKSIKDKEGAFALCSFWNVEFLARGGGTLEEANNEFAQVIAHANDVGLFGEEIEVKSGRTLGNFPQAYTHIGLINAALSIETREKQERK